MGKAPNIIVILGQSKGFVKTFCSLVSPTTAEQAESWSMRRKGAQHADVPVRNLVEITVHGLSVVWPTPARRHYKPAFFELGQCAREEIWWRQHIGIEE